MFKNVSDRKKQCLISFSICSIIFVLFFAIKSVIVFSMVSPFIFSDEQSYFGMADKISHLNWHNIYNSHMPGYSLLIAPFYKMASTSFGAYRNVLTFNAFISSLPVIIIYILCRKTFSLNQRKSIVITILGSLSTAFFSYTYVVMSEVAQSVFYLLAFSIMTDIYLSKEKTKLYKYIFLEIILGFLPIIKTQAMITLILFILFFILYYSYRFSKLERHKVLITVTTSVLIYFIFRFIIFKNVGLYEEQSKDNLLSMLSVFQNANNFKSFINITFAEFAVLFVYTGILPFYFIIRKVLTNYREYNKEQYFVLAFIIILILAHIGITIIHAYWVYCDKGIATVYTRYLDFFQPILITTGMIILLSNEKQGNLNNNVIAIILIFLIAVFFPNIGKIEANTLTVEFFQNIPQSLYYLICFIAIIMIVLYKPSINYYLVCSVFLCVILINMNISAVQTQLKRGDEMRFVYPEPYYFATHSICGETIILDNSISEISKREDYYPAPEKNNGNLEIIDENIVIDFNYKYSMMFWAIKNNTVSQEQIALSKDAYICTNKLIPREPLVKYGPVILYDRIPQNNSYEVNTDLLYRTTSGDLEFANENYLRIKNNVLNNNLFINNITSIFITLKFADNIIPAMHDGDIALYINGELMKCEDNTASHEAIFSFYNPDEFDIESLTITFGDSFNDMITDGTLYIGSMNLNYN